MLHYSQFSQGGSLSLSAPQPLDTYSSGLVSCSVISPLAYGLHISGKLWSEYFCTLQLFACCLAQPYIPFSPSIGGLVNNSLYRLLRYACSQSLYSRVFICGHGRAGCPTLRITNEMGAPSFRAFCERVGTMKSASREFHVHLRRKRIFPQPSLTRTRPESPNRSVPTQSSIFQSVTKVSVLHPLRVSPAQCQILTVY